MPEFKVGDRVVVDKDLKSTIEAVQYLAGRETVVLEDTPCESNSVMVRSLLDPEDYWWVNPEQLTPVISPPSTIESCLKFLTEQGFSVTLTKG